MKYLSTQDIPLKDIDASNRLRVVNEDWVKGISESFANIGQKEPIEVVAQTNGKKYRLVAGGHRLAAAALCGWQTIRAEIKQTVTDNFDLEVRLHEIDENLIRNELNALDRAVFLGERQRIYEAMYPDSRADVAGGKKRQNPASDIVSFAESTAEKIDISERTVQRAVTIFKNLSPEIRAKISGTDLANKQGELYKLTRINPEHHKQIIAACLRVDNPRPIVVDEAERAIKNISILENLRDLSDMMEMPVVLVGREFTLGRLKRHTQIYTRISSTVSFERAKRADVVQLATELCEVKVADDLIDIMLKQADGTIREVMKALKNIERLGLRNKSDTVTADMVKGMELCRDDQKPGRGK